MPKHTSSKLLKSKCTRELTFDDDPIMKLCQYQNPSPNLALLQSQTINSNFVEDIFLSDNEETSWPELSQAFGLEDMVEKGADIQVVNIFPEAGPMLTPIKPTFIFHDTDLSIIIPTQVNDYPPTLVIRAPPATNPEILDVTYAAEVDMV
jgi:hypothetical protein